MFGDEVRGEDVGSKVIVGVIVCGDKVGFSVTGILGDTV